MFSVHLNCPLHLRSLPYPPISPPLAECNRQTADSPTPFPRDTLPRSLSSRRLFSSLPPSPIQNNVTHLDTARPCLPAAPGVRRHQPAPCRHPAQRKA